MEKYKVLLRADERDVEALYGAFSIIADTGRRCGLYKEAFWARLMQTQSAIALNLLEEYRTQNTNAQLSLDSSC